MCHAGFCSSDFDDEEYTNESQSNTNKDDMEQYHLFAGGFFSMHPPRPLPSTKSTPSTDIPNKGEQKQ